MYVTVRCEMVPRSVSSKHPSHTHTDDSLMPADTPNATAGALGPPVPPETTRTAERSQTGIWRLDMKKPMPPFSVDAVRKKEAVWYLLPLAVS